MKIQEEYVLRHRWTGLYLLVIVLYWFAASSASGDGALHCKIASGICFALLYISCY